MTEAVLARRDYQRRVRTKLWVLVLLTLALLLSLLVNVSIGASSYSPIAVARALFSDAPEHRQLHAIIWHLRLPSALMAIVVGACLAAAGAQMQTVLNNPLAGPFTLGISAAASFGAALAFAFGSRFLPVAAEYLVPLNAFAMAMLASVFIHAVSVRHGGRVETVVLLGIAMVFSFNSLVALVQFFATEEAIAAVVFWTMGSLTRATWTNLAAVSLVALLVPIFFYRNAWALTTMRLGDAKAASLGINVHRIRLITLLCVSLLAAFPVAFVGTIGFVGLVGPHIARMILGEDQRFFLPGAMLVGALTLSVASVISKVLVPGVIFPIGVVTSLIGIPIFVLLILNKRNALW